MSEKKFMLQSHVLCIEILEQYVEHFDKNKSAHEIFSKKNNLIDLEQHCNSSNVDNNVRIYNEIFKYFFFKYFDIDLCEIVVINGVSIKCEFLIIFVTNTQKEKLLHDFKLLFDLYERDIDNKIIENHPNLKNEINICSKYYPNLLNGWQEISDAEYNKGFK